MKILRHGSIYQILVPILLTVMATGVFARDFVIYSISQDIPMGVEGEVLKKNYYVNVGANQGIASGTRLDVFRIISQYNPYDSNKRYNYKVKIGEIEVVHAEDEAAIGRSVAFLDGESTPVVELKDLMIGDHVNVKVE